MAERRYVPLVQFSDWLQHGDLADELTRRLPQSRQAIVDRSNSQAEERPTEPRRPNWGPWLVAAVIVVAIATGIVIASGAAIGPALMRIVIGMTSLALFGYGSLNAVASINRFRARRYVASGLWMTFAIVQWIVGLSFIRWTITGF